MSRPAFSPALAGNADLQIGPLGGYNNRRYFLPWRPIRVSPIGVSRFFSDRGLEVLKSDLLCIWIPSAVLAALAWLWHRHRRARTV